MCSKVTRLGKMNESTLEIVETVVDVISKASVVRTQNKIVHRHCKLIHTQLKKSSQNKNKAREVLTKAPGSVFRKLPISDNEAIVKV